MHGKRLATALMRYAVPLAVAVPLVVGNMGSGGPELERVFGGAGVDGQESIINPRQDMARAWGKRQSESNNSTNWNDVQANPIGVNKALGWDYDFCRLQWPRTAIVDNKLYIDGGILWLSPKGKGLQSIREINTRLVEIDISSPITQDNYTVRVISKPTSVPNVSAGQTFLPPPWPSNNGRFYTFGGFFPNFNSSLDTYTKPPKDPQGDLFSYDTKSDKWEEVAMAKDSDTVIWPQEGTSVSIPELGLGFYLGGFQNSSTNSVLKDNEYRAVPGFLRLEWNVKDPTVAPKWKNESIPFDQTIGGSLIHIPDIGEKGILIMFGGLGVITGDNSPMSGNPMEQIYIYNIAKATWHAQTASVESDGSAFPTPRGYTCNAVVPAKDKSSYNIYAYGGGGRGGGDGLDDMWVLSLPSFVWIKFWEKGNFRTIGMSCTLFNENQVLLVGPRVKRIGDNPNADQTQCRPLWSVYDITQSKWVTEFDPLRTELAPVHRNISKVIGGGGDGNAVLTEPKAGWKDTNLKAVFEYKRNTTNDSNKNSTITNPNTTNTTNNNNNNNTNSSFNRGALIGGLAGGLVALLILIACCIKRRRTGGFKFTISGRKRQSNPTQELEAPLPMVSSPEGYHSQDLIKYVHEQPPQELAAPYPWARREGMGEDPSRSRSEMHGGWEHQYEGVVSETPPPEWQQSNPQQAGDSNQQSPQQESASLLPHVVGLSQQGEADRGSRRSLPMDTPPPEAYQPQTQSESTSRPVRKKAGGGEGAQERAVHTKRPSSRFSEDL